MKCSVIIYTNKITAFSITFGQPKLHLGRQVRQSKRLRSKVNYPEFGYDSKSYEKGVLGLPGVIEGRNIPMFCGFE